MTTLAHLVLLITSVIHTIPSQQPCTGAASAPALDHVVLVVRDLDVASAEFEKRGFRLKPGRLHPNNLLNRHIKFRDGSEIELMTLAGRPGDALAEDYLTLLEASEGGVYVALKVTDIAAPQRAAAMLRLGTRHSASGPWQFLSFPPSSPAAALFFSEGVSGVHDPDSLVSHDPDVSGLAEAWVEGGSAMGELLGRLGAAHCGPARSVDGHIGQRWGLSRGSIVIVPARALARARLLGVVLQRRTPGESIVYPHRDFCAISPPRNDPLYTKHHLGAFSTSASHDGTVPPAEATVFDPGTMNPLVRFGGNTAAVAVCADTGPPSHPLEAAARGARTYFASMFIIPSEFEMESASLAAYAQQHCMTVALANYGGASGGLAAAGRSAIWSDRGELLAQLDASGTGAAVAIENHYGWRAHTTMLDKVEISAGGLVT